MGGKSFSDPASRRTRVVCDAWSRGAKSEWEAAHDP